jgi:hypothetical protein
MELQDLLDTLERLRKKHARSADYQTIRRDLPKDWPL